MAAIELEKLVSYYKDNKMSHAYLIETNNPETCFQELLYVIKKMCCPYDYSDNCEKCNLCYLIDKENMPSIKVVYPDGSFIKKEQILELKKAFSTMPVYTKNNIYIINYADKLNASSANTMLKFVEEPDENILGFFICTNRNNVISTIVSRCEVIMVKYDEKSLTMESIYKDDNLLKIYNITRDYLYKIEVEKTKSIMYNKDVLADVILEKEQVVVLFKIILLIYEEALNNNKNIINENSFLSKLTNYQIINRIKLITSFLEDINYNANRDLLLDKFVIELSDIDEKSI